MNGKQKIFFTSDLHVGHNSIIKHDNRPFRDMVHMKRVLIQRWNTRVSDTDRVYMLGDFSFAGMVESEEFLSQLNGQIVLVRGNHDSSARRLIKMGFHDVLENHRLWIDGIGYVYLSHFPYAGAEEGEKQRCPHKRIVDDGETLLLHGHVHGYYVFRPRMINVGCMVHDYTVVSVDDIKLMIEKNPWIIRRNYLKKVRQFRFSNKKR